MKLRARKTWKQTATETQYFLQYDHLVVKYVQFDGERFRAHKSLKTEMEGPLNEETLERRMALALNRLGIVPGSLQVIEKKVDGPRKRRSLEQCWDAA